MKKQSYYLSVAALGLLITTAAVGITSFAASSDNSNQNATFGRPQQQGPGKHSDATMEAITNNDYSAWEAAMKQRVENMRTQANELEQAISQDTFDKMVSAHQLMADGKTDEAKAIFEELGMKGPGNGPRPDDGGQGNFGKRPCPNQDSTENSNTGQ